MGDFFEIDFLQVESNKSGDAITIRYQLNGQTTIHVVDGGFQDTGDSIISHISQYYDNATYIDRVILTHPDGDHAGGLQKVLRHFSVGELWMIRPWIYSNELIHRFSKYTSVENLEKRLKEIYPNVAALEDIAIEKKIKMYEPFQGARIGEFTVLSPTKEFYLDMVVESEKTPESVKSEEKSASFSLSTATEKFAKRILTFIRSLWGEERFSTEETSSENEMSIIQYSRLNDKNILLTGDAGRKSLELAIQYAPFAGLVLPGIDRFQIPHHGSRRNLSTELLDNLLGPRLREKRQPGQELFTSIASASQKDEDHPRKAVIRAMIHRGGKAITNETANLRTSANAPHRDGWSTAIPLEYPEEQEE